MTLCIQFPLSLNNYLIRIHDIISCSLSPPAENAKAKFTDVVGGFRGDKSGILEAQVVILSPTVQKIHPRTSDPHQWE